MKRKQLTWRGSVNRINTEKDNKFSF